MAPPLLLQVVVVMRTVFIGNISFDATEEDLRNLFGSVGPVVNLRLVTDRETGKRKGFGFVEYSHEETAFSAVRNLNELNFHGRALRVNLAEQDSKGNNAGDPAASRKRKDRAPASNSAGGAGDIGAGGATFAPPPPELLARPPMDPITAYVEKLSRAQMFELAIQAKHFVATQPAEAASLFANRPQLYGACQLIIDRLAGPHWPSL